MSFFSGHVADLLRLAVDEARMLGRVDVEPEHMLLAFCRHGHGRDLLAQLPPVMRQEHDQHRGRLDLYCSLVLVFLAIGAAAIPILGSAVRGTRSTAVLVAVGLCLAAAWLSYRAAIASARKYGLVLKTITANFELPDPG